MQPNQQAPVPVYPEPAPVQPPTPPTEPPQPPTQHNKVTLNPFSHLFKGAYNLLSSNLVSSLFAGLIWFVIVIVLEVVFIAALFGMLLSGLGSGKSYSALDIYGSIIAFMIVLTLLGSYFGSVLSRLIVTGARRQRVSLGEGFRMAKNRFRITVLTMLMIVGVLLLVGIVLSFIFAALASVLGFATILIALVVVTAAIVLYLRYTYVPFVLVDDAEPTGVSYAFHRSQQLWSKSWGAMITYAITITVGLVLVSAALSANTFSDFSGTQTQTRSTTSGPSIHSYQSSSLDQELPSYTSPIYQQPSRSSAGIGLGVAIFSAVASAIISMLIWAGMAKIYNDAQEIVDGKAAGDDMVGPTVATDNAPMPEPPVTSQPLPVTPVEAPTQPAVNPPETQPPVTPTQ